MFTDFDSAKDFLEENEIPMVDLKWCDLYGKWHHVTLTAKAFTPEVMRDGIGFDGSSVGIKPVTAGDMILIPDLTTGFIDPFFEEPTLSFISDIYEADSKLAFEHDPREFVRKADAYMKQTGIADQSLWGPEYEFFIFDEVSYSTRSNKSSYFVNSYEANWESNEDKNGYLVPVHKGYHRIAPSDQNQNLRNEICMVLEDLGYPVKYYHHEGSGPGQNEIEPPLLDIVKSTDGTLMAKYVAKNLAYLYGKTITFMPKPLFGEAGNGMHFHQMLWKDGKNLFYQKGGYNNLSQTALYYVGGILKHALALCALTNPSTNSYKRLAPGYEAPTSCFFGKGDRNAAVRSPKYATDPSEVRIEYRTPDATCNPYIAIPAMLLAGLDGILNKIDPREHNFGPFDEDVLKWPPEKLATIRKMPANLNAALDELERDHEFLFQGGVFSPQFIQTWVKNKRAEANEMGARPHPYEVELYVDC